MRKINKRVWGTGVEKIEFQKTAKEEYNLMRKMFLRIENIKTEYLFTLVLLF